MARFWLVLPMLLTVTLPGVGRAQIGVPHQVIPRQSAEGVRITDFTFVLDLPIANRDLYEQNFVGFPTVARLFVSTEHVRLHGGLAALKGSDPLGGGVSVGGSAGVAVHPSRRLGEVDVELRAGVNYSDFDHPGFPNFQQVDIPVALGLSLFGPLPWRLNGAGWAAARGHVRISDRLDPLADAKETMWGGGLSLGLMIERLGTSEDVRRIGTGFGFMVNGEWLWLPSDEYPPGSDHELLLSVGVFVRFSKFRV